jgi:hypothetical protein
MREGGVDDGEEEDDVLAEAAGEGNAGDATEEDADDRTASRCSSGSSKCGLSIESRRESVIMMKEETVQQRAGRGRDATLHALLGGSLARWQRCPRRRQHAE